MTKPIPESLRKSLYWALTESDVLDSDEALRKFLDRESLRTWANSPNDASSIGARVSMLIDWFTNKRLVPGFHAGRWFDGLDAQRIFLVELYLHHMRGTLSDIPEKLWRLLQLMGETQFLIDMGDFLSVDTGDGIFVTFCRHCGTSYPELPVEGTHICG